MQKNHKKKENSSTLKNDLIKDLVAGRVKKALRTTFTLSSKSLQIIESIGNQRGYTHGEIFEFAARMIDAIKEFKIERGPSQKSDEPETKKSKTFVLNPSTKNRITDKSKEMGIPRDTLVELLLEALNNFLEQLDEKEMKTIEHFQARIADIWKEMDELRDVIGAELGSYDHFVPASLWQASTILMNIDMGIDKFLVGDGWPEDI